jgi:hypothetical protein
MVRFRRRTLMSFVFALMVRVAWAQEVGTVATLEGTADVGRGDTGCGSGQPRMRERTRISRWSRSTSRNSGTSSANCRSRS